MNIIGPLILIIMAVGIITLRNETKKHGGPILNTYMKVTDTYNTIRFIGVLLLIGMLFIFSKK